VPLGSIPRGRATATCGPSTSCTAEASWLRASMQNAHGIQAGMYVLDLGCGLGGASRYLAAECGCRVAAIDLTPNFVEAARILTARCGLAERIEFRQANALALPFPDSTFDHAWSYAVTMNIADKEGLGRQVARVLKPGGRFSCNEIVRRSGGTPAFPLPWASDEDSSFLVSPAKMRAALEAGGLSVIEQVDLTATRLGETGRQPVIERDDFPLRLHNLQSCLADGRLIASLFLRRGAFNAAPRTQCE